MTDAENRRWGDAVLAQVQKDTGCIRRDVASIVEALGDIKTRLALLESGFARIDKHGCDLAASCPVVTPAPAPTAMAEPPRNGQFWAGVIATLSVIVTLGALIWAQLKDLPLGRGGH